MEDFIEFPIFTGVSGDLRPWISWLEAFFVREKFKKHEKMNLAQSLLEGEAEAWFYLIQKTLIFYSWRELKDKLLLRFGDVADSDRIRLIAEQDRFLMEIRDEARIRRRKTTSIPVKDTIRETITVVEEISEIVDGNLDERASEKKSITQNQVPVSSLEPSLSFASKPVDVSASWPCAFVSNTPVHSQSGFASVKNMNDAHHVFDEWSHRRHQVLHDPGGKKDDHSDDIFDTEVDIDNVQRPQVVTVAESVSTTPDNVAESVVTAPAIVASSSKDAASYTDVITKRQRWDEACDAEIDVLDGTATWTVSAYVTAFEELSTQVIALEDSHLEQIFNEGLKTELQEVLKLKAPVGLENQKKNRGLKALMFNFKRQKKRIKRWFNTLSCRKSWRKHKLANLQLVSGLVGFNVGDFRCHKEYGLARRGNWSQVRVEYSLLQGELFCKNTLPRKPVTSSMLPLYVYQMGVSDIQDNDKEMVADPVSLQLILDDMNVAGSLEEKASYTEKKLLLQYPKMDSTNGNGVDVEAANGANAANGGGDIDALPPPPPILPPHVEPLHVKNEHVEKKNLRVPMVRTGIGTKGQKIPLLPTHFKVDVADLQGHFYHYSVALFSDDDRPVEAKGMGRKILDTVHEPHHSDLVGKEFAYDGEKTLFTYGVLPDNKMDFAVVLEVVSAARANGNASPNGNENDGTTSIWHRWRRKD